MSARVMDAALDAITPLLADRPDGTPGHIWLLSWSMIVSGVAAFFYLLYGPSATAPYGRYHRGGWGFAMNAKLAWVLQEVPSFLVPLLMSVHAVATWRAGAGDTPAFLRGGADTALYAAFMAHYFQRSLVFPFFIRGGKPTPFWIFVMSFVFCIWNGYIQGWLLTVRGAADGTGEWSAQAAAGLAVWAVGCLTNLHADHVLRTLRKPGETGYKIPYGGAFRFVTAANYFGENVEWLGYAAATGFALPAVAFSSFTFFNLAPRAHEHHKWYKRKFDDYPTNRWAIVPLLW
ncbi:unnamed protein product [Pedinophyceae sp. YPF-701]|nr:unnamed protein product [Pedinophyceae sp. YPF-701]